ncbi:MAG: aldo/keto reductase [Alphaproteobacteria bacterium]|nr:aldo/keto reductase [Alphaproteobacteria bacterium]
MKRRPLGSTGLEVAPVALGTVKLGRNRGVKYPHAFEIPDDKQATRLLDAASSLGINLLDTAPAYGGSEARLGALLAGRRERFLISTKVGERFDGARSRFDFTPEAIAASVRRSLQRLRTDRLDLVLVHSDGRDLELITTHGVFDALRELVARGLVRAYGMSCKTLDGGRRAVEEAHAAMVPFSRADPRHGPVLERAAQLGRPVLVKKVFDSGHLLASDNTAERLQSALRPALRHPGVAAVVIGTCDVTHLTADVEAARAVLEEPS